MTESQRRTPGEAVTRAGRGQSRFGTQLDGVGAVPGKQTPTRQHSSAAQSSKVVHSSALVGVHARSPSRAPATHVP